MGTKKCVNDNIVLYTNTLETVPLSMLEGHIVSGDQLHQCLVIPTQ